MHSATPRSRFRLLALGAALVACARLTQADEAPPSSDAPAADMTSPEFFEQKIKPLLVETCYECHGEKKQESGLRLDSYASFVKGTDTGPIVVPGEPETSRLVAAIRYGGQIKMPPDMKLFPEEINLLTEWVRAGAHWPRDPNADATTPSTPEKIYDADGRMAEAKRTHWAFQLVKMPEVPAVSNPAWPRDDVDHFILAALDEKNIDPSPEADRHTLIRRLYYDLIGLPPDPADVEAFVRDDRPEAYGELVEKLLAMPQYGERWARHWLDVSRYADTRGYVGPDDRFFPFSYTYRDYVVRAFNTDLPYDQFILQQLAADKLDLGEDKRPLAAMGFLTLGRRFLNVTNDIIDDRIDVTTRGLLGLTVTCARCHDHKFDPIPAADYYSLYGVFRSSQEPADLPLIEEPNPDDPQYQEYLRIIDQKESEANAYQSTVHVDLLKHAHTRIGEYLLGARLARDITEDEAFLRKAKELGLNHQLLKRWVTFFQTDRAADPVFAVWCALAPIPDESFAASAATTLAALKSGGATLNTRIAKTFETTPATLAEAAERYQALLAEIDERWVRLAAERVQVALETNTTPRLPDALPDPSDEALRQALYAPGYPATITLADAFDLSEVPERERIRALRNNVTNHKATHPGRPDRAMVLADAAPYEPYVFLRGKEDNKGEVIPRRFIGVLSAEDRAPFTEGSGRLELARAIASPENPLTARVFVNRVWAHHFGKPLVSTPSDFGLRSDPPSHPELLDYLARRFMDEGWSVKNLHRTIVRSAAYRQASLDRPDAAAADPENRLLWKQNRRRLDFESMRDSLLAMAGTLDLAQGGPALDLFSSPFPPRRTLYGLVERQNLPSVFRSFDFATPDAHAPQRYETVVPQQALFLMNSPFAIEQARAFAARPELTASSDPDARADAMLRLTFQRDPSPEEKNLVREFLARDFDKGPLPPPPSAWHYGFGGVDHITGRVTDFTPFGVFSDAQWRVSAAMPDPDLGFVALGSRGGHPGRSADTAAIRRWVAPVDGVVRISGRLRHSDPNGDGVTGLVVSSRHGVLGRWTVHNSLADMTHEQVSVASGDAIDFVAECRTGDAFDSFEWPAKIRYIETPEDAKPYRSDWETRTDFEGPPAPPPPPLGPWEQLAQVLLLSNELMYVD